MKPYIFVIFQGGPPVPPLDPPMGSCAYTLKEFVYSCAISVTISCARSYGFKINNTINFHTSCYISIQILPRQHPSEYIVDLESRYKLACMPIEDSDQPAHQRSLISLGWALYV